MYLTEEDYIGLLQMGVSEPRQIIEHRDHRCRKRGAGGGRGQGANSLKGGLT